jgi:hypothetical protein
MFRNLSFSRAHPPRRDRAEPRLLPANAPLPFRRPADQDPTSFSAIRNEGVSATRGDEPRPSPAPVIFTADQRPPPDVRHRARPLRELALAGCIVLGVGAVAGAGFLLLAPPQTDSAGPTARNVSEPAASNSSASPTPSAPSSASATAAIPNASDTQHGATGHSAAPSPAGAAPEMPAAVRPEAPPNNTSAKAMPAPSPAPKPARTAIAATHVAAEPPAAKPHPAPDKRAAVPQIEARRPVHPRPAVRHVRLEAAHETPPPQAKFDAAQSPPRPPERPAPTALSSTSPQMDQAASFDRLINQLTGPARPPDQALTPPAPGLPDPFAQHR